MTAASPATISLYDRLRTRQPRVPVTALLIVVNLLIFSLMLGAGAGLWHGGQNSVQLSWGANFGPATQDGQWWRLGSALFLHFGVLHLGMNLWALWDGGQLVERAYGSPRFAAIYVGSGLAGNLLSLVMQGNQAVSGGASGAIFGIYGALLAFLWRERQALPASEFRWLFLAASLFTLVSIGLGLFVSGIDNSAHVGGLISGLLLALLFGWPALMPAVPASPPASTLGPRLLAGAILVAGIALLILRLPEPKYVWHEEVAARDEIREFFEREVRIQQSWQDILRKDAPAGDDLEAIARRIEAEIADPYAVSAEQLSGLDFDSPIPSATQIETLRRYSEARRDQSQALAQKLRDQARFGPAARGRSESVIPAQPAKP